MTRSAHQIQISEAMKLHWKGRRQSKYGAVPTVVDGVRFDSKREAARYGELLLLQRGGKIANLKLQPRFVLANPVKFSDEARTKPALRYVGDFSYLEGNRLVVEDVKSPSTAKTAAFRIKRHLVMSIFDIDVRVIR